jgi:hypothetical protein
MYARLREICLSEANQKEYPGWPFPMLFHGKEITREVFLLDPVLEYGVLELGRNRVRDGDVFRYRHLNDWFHYQFFNGINWVVNSAEAYTLLPRLLCLERNLLDAMQTRTIHSYLEQELGIVESDRALENIMESLRQITGICRSHPLLVWGMKIDEVDAKAHQDYVASVSEIPSAVVFALPHIRRLTFSWDAVMKDEEKQLGRAVARYNRWRKQQLRLPRSHRT